MATFNEWLNIYEVEHVDGNITLHHSGYPNAVVSRTRDVRNSIKMRSLIDISMASVGWPAQRQFFFSFGAVETAQTEGRHCFRFWGHIQDTLIIWEKSCLGLKYVIFTLYLSGTGLTKLQNNMWDMNLGMLPYRLSVFKFFFHVHTLTRCKRTVGCTVSRWYNWKSSTTLA